MPFSPREGLSSSPAGAGDHLHFVGDHENWVFTSLLGESVRAEFGTGSEVLVKTSSTMPRGSCTSNTSISSDAVSMRNVTYARFFIGRSGSKPVPIGRWVGGPRGHHQHAGASHARSSGTKFDRNSLVCLAVRGLNNITQQDKTEASFFLYVNRIKQQMVLCDRYVLFNSTSLSFFNEDGAARVVLHKSCFSEGPSVMQDRVSLKQDLNDFLAEADNPPATLTGQQQTLHEANLVGMFSGRIRLRPTVGFFHEVECSAQQVRDHGPVVLMTKAMKRNVQSADEDDHLSTSLGG